MSWLVSGWVKNSNLGSGTRKGVMLVVADYCTEDAKQLGIAVPDGWAVCWAGVDTIAARAEFSEKTVRRTLDDMEAAGVIRRDRRHDARGWRDHDLIWIEYARRFVDLTDSDGAAEPDNSNRSQSPVGDSLGQPETPPPTPSSPVDNSAQERGLADSDDAPTGLSHRDLADSDARPPHPPIRKNPQEEPPTNRQDHVESARTDRAPARHRTRSSSQGGPAPPATGHASLAATPSHTEGPP